MANTSNCLFRNLKIASFLNLQNDPNVNTQSNLIFVIQTKYLVLVVQSCLIVYDLRSAVSERIHNDEE